MTVSQVHHQDMDKNLEAAPCKHEIAPGGQGTNIVAALTQRPGANKEGSNQSRIGLQAGSFDFRSLCLLCAPQVSGNLQRRSRRRPDRDHVS